jgi:hypothetical protein
MGGRASERHAMDYHSGKLWDIRQYAIKCKQLAFADLHLPKETCKVKIFITGQWLVCFGNISGT